MYMRREGCKVAKFAMTECNLFYGLPIGEDLPAIVAKCPVFQRKPAQASTGLNGFSRARTRRASGTASYKLTMREEHLVRIEDWPPDTPLPDRRAVAYNVHHRARGPAGLIESGDGVSFCAPGRRCMHMSAIT